MRPWLLSLVLLGAALPWQPNAKADDERDYWRHRHHEWHHWHPYAGWQERREHWRHHHHYHHEIIDAGPVRIER